MSEPLDDDPWAPWSLTAAVRKRLDLTPEQHAEFCRRYIQWSESLRPFEEALKRSQHITAADLAITVTNPDKW